MNKSSIPLFLIFSFLFLSTAPAFGENYLKKSLQHHYLSDFCLQKLREIEHNFDLQREYQAMSKRIDRFLLLPDLQTPVAKKLTAIRQQLQGQISTLKENYQKMKHRLLFAGCPLYNSL